MITLVADQTPLSVLALAVEPVEILDGNGVLLGTFTPTDLDRGRTLYEKAQALFASKEKTAQSVPADQCKTTAEVLKRLRELAPVSPIAMDPSAEVPAGRTECTKT